MFAELLNPNKPMNYQNISINYQEKVACVNLNRPEKANALSKSMFFEIRHAMESFDNNEEVRVVLISGNGKHFCAGIDLDVLKEVLDNAQNCEGRLREELLHEIFTFQKCINAVEECRKPVIAAIHGACVGAGLDLVCACDIRYSTQDASFSIREVDMGMVADLGTLQRLPKMISSSLVRELAFTGQKITGSDAKEYGIVSRVFENHQDLLQEAMKVATLIALKSPLAVRGIKENLNFSRDHTVEEGLKYVAAWNSGMLLSNDIKEIFLSLKEGRSPQFND